MGILNNLFGKKKNAVNDYFKSFIAYSPAFTSWAGGIYEMAATRSAIHAFASHASKLKIEVVGEARKRLGGYIEHDANPWMTTSKFLYRVATIYSVDNTCFIIPVENPRTGEVIGYFPLMPSMCELVTTDSRPDDIYVRYTFSNGKMAAIEFEKTAIITQHQYEDDFFGEDNKALLPTMQLMHLQNQSIRNAIVNTAAIRFLGRIPGLVSNDDLKMLKESFTEANLKGDNASGVAFYDNRISDIKQIESKPYTVNGPQMEQINQNVYSYFGVTKEIIQNCGTEEQKDSFFEGKISPFALQLGQALTNITFDRDEISQGSRIILTSNRWKEKSDKTKLDTAVQLFDRGLLSINGVMEMFNLSPVAGGDKRFIRKEYAEIGSDGKVLNNVPDLMEGK